MYYVYILYSILAKKFYIGSTSDIEKRIQYHNSGRSKYTKGKGPWVLVYSEPHENRGEAMARERTIKGWKSSKRIVAEFHIKLESLGSSGPVVTIRVIVNICV